MFHSAYVSIEAPMKETQISPVINAFPLVFQIPICHDFLSLCPCRAVLPESFYGRSRTLYPLWILKICVFRLIFSTQKFECIIRNNTVIRNLTQQYHFVVVHYVFTEMIVPSPPDVTDSWRHSLLEWNQHKDIPLRLSNYKNRHAIPIRSQ